MMSCVSERQNLGGDGIFSGAVYRKVIACLSAFSRHLDSAVSFELRQEERRDGGEESCTDIPSYGYKEASNGSLS